jgi:hypothetical protein
MELRQLGAGEFLLRELERELFEGCVQHMRLGMEEPGFPVRGA